MSVMDPQTHQRAEERPRPKSTFSFRSDRSGSTAKSSKRETLVESHEEKRKTYLSSTTKANPNAAITELQPIAAALEKPTLGSLRSGSYTDQHGNPITEPDLSNPTRPRWERPLDTIRSFEAAIDAEYKTRQTLLRPDTGAGTNDGNGYSSRRSSSYWGGGYDQARPRYPSAGGGYYGGPNRDSYAENGSYSTPPAAGPGRYRQSVRQLPDPTQNRFANSGTGIYPAPGHQQSRDTVNTGITGGSGGSGSEAYVSGTDPTSGSENSSIEKNNPPSRPENEGQYGYQNYGMNPTFRNPIMEEGGSTSRSYNQGGLGGGYGYFSQSHVDSPPPAPPPKTETATPVQKPIVLDGMASIPESNTQRSSGNNKLQRPSVHKVESAKRKSWLARRFSRN